MVIIARASQYTTKRQIDHHISMEYPAVDTVHHTPDSLIPISVQESVNDVPALFSPPLSRYSNTSQYINVRLAREKYEPLSEPDLSTS